MHRHSETAALARRDGSVISKGVVPLDYRNSPASANEIASAIIAARFRITPCMARLVVELAQFGGRFG